MPVRLRCSVVKGHHLPQECITCAHSGCHFTRGYLGPMKPNRSIPPSAIIPVLTYPDVRQAVDWLCRVFGFEERVRIGENHRAQLAFGDGGGLIVADTYGSRQAPEGDGITHSVMVRVGDVTAHFEYARAEGAKIVSEPADFPFGERQYTV